MSTLAAVVLTYDGRALLETILPTLAAQTLPGVRTVVVDNGSSDGTPEWLATEWPLVEVVALPENIGVTAALNECVRAAGDADYVALLNNDLELDPRALEELVAALDRHPDAGSAGAKLIDFGDRSVIDGAGDTFSWSGTGGRRGHGERDIGQYDTPEPVFGACGGAAVYRREALRDVGPFDESFFAFFEDVDWAYRAQLAGWSCRYVPSAVVFHMGSATIGRGMSDFTQYHLWRNAIWLMAKGHPAAAWLRHAPWIAYVQAAQLFIAVRGGRFGLWRRAVGDALKGLPRVRTQRRAVQGRRRSSMPALEAAAALGQPARRSSARRPKAT